MIATRKDVLNLINEGGVSIEDALLAIAEYAEMFREANLKHGHAGAVAHYDAMAATLRAAAKQSRRGN